MTIFNPKKPDVQIFCALLFPLLLVVGCGGESSSSSAAIGSGQTSTGGGSTGGVTSLITPSSTLNDGFFNYTRPADYEVTTSDVNVPVRGGTHVFCKLGRPALKGQGTPVAGRLPGVIGEFHPYSTINMVPVFLVERGYNTLTCDYPGSGNSPGTFEQFSMASTLANYDVIQWFADQEWSDGNIGQMGSSFGGHTSNLVARLNPPNLKAIVPNSSMSDWYSNTIYHGGIRNGSILYQPAVIGGTGCVDQNKGLGSSCLNSITGISEDTYINYTNHPLFDDYWKERSVEPYYANFKAKTLSTNGWNDRYKGGTIKNYKALKENFWVLLGPWGHSSYDGGQRGTLVAANHQLAWFDLWLKGMSDVPMPKAKVTSFEMPNNESSTGWYHFSDWPPPESRLLTRFLAGGGLMNSSSPSEPVQATWMSNGIDVGADPASGITSAPIDQRLFDMMPFRLTFTSPAETRDLVLTGNPVVHVEASFTGTDGHVVVRLMDVAPSGAVSQISTGWLKASHYKGHDHLEVIKPGTFYPLSIEMNPTHYRLVKGHSLRVSFSSGDFPDAIYDLPPGSVTVKTGSRSFFEIHALPGGAAGNANTVKSPQ